MTLEEYYELLKSAWERVDKNNLQAIKQYNEWKRELRREVISVNEKEEI